MSQPIRHDDEGDGTQHRVRRRVRDRLISPDGALYRLQDAGPECPMNLHSAICQWIEAALSTCLRTIGRGEQGRPARISAGHMARWLGAGSAILPLPLKWPPSVLALIRADSARVAMGVRLTGEKRPRVTHTRKVVKVARTEPRGDTPQSMQQRMAPRSLGTPVGGHAFNAAGTKRKLVTKIRPPAPSMPQGNYRTDATGPRRMFVKKPIMSPNRASQVSHVSHTPHVSHVSQAAHVPHAPPASHSSHVSQPSHATNAAQYPGPDRTERTLAAPAPPVRPPVVDTSF